MAQSLEPVSDSVSPSLSALPLPTLCLSLSPPKLNIKKKNLKRNALPLKVARKKVGAPGWRSWLSVRLQPGHDLVVREFEPRVRLWADGSEPGACFRFCVSLSLCPSPVHALSLSVPKINKR